ncbi:hypothetical protein BDF21DRAFT_355458 [Thamnidium elegans]|uniref:UDP-glycosyltransferases domain-containing protein n=1 Tax=Thamnidium elegans TaxID=101142 RepID=A0A8H7SRS8_9FUNG|nr:hypothetical protein INT48_008555 [Thamnidium elegans]KAI8094675.1 hypothetical protein BDF21DRAFT_355458 [Thamnidium elegans]
MKASLTLLSATLVCATVNALELQPTFREGNYKHVAFSASIGGSSHHNWVLSILDEVGQRGHKASYLTTTTETRFGRPYSTVETIDIGPTDFYENNTMMEDVCDGKPMSDVLPQMITLLNTNYERDYAILFDYFNRTKVDLALCDHFMEVCVDAAMTLNIPFILTSSLEITSETGASYINNNIQSLEKPTTEFETLYSRFKSKFIAPWTLLYNMYPAAAKIVARKQALGINAKFEPPEETWKHSIKLVNNVFGYTPARSIGPMAEQVGPIIPKSYSPLTADLENFLTSHNKVAYIGFGQNAIPTKKDVLFILTTLLESLEQGYIDGFIWSIFKSAKLFPETVTTSSGVTYAVHDILSNNNSHTLMMSWVPQTAILLHPSTSTFVSHGGLGSWYESIYAGKPMLMLPFFGDQPSNSFTIEREGLGYILNRKASPAQVSQLFNKVADKTGEIIKNVKRMQALTQIHSEHGIIRGADVVEEVLYSNKNGRLPHRVPASTRMSYIKANNIDLYAALVLCIVAGSSLVAAGAYKPYKLFSQHTKMQKKLKNL